MDILGLEKRLEDLQSYFESGCVVYTHALTITDKIDVLIEIDKTLDEANDVWRMLGKIGVEKQKTP